MLKIIEASFLTSSTSLKDVLCEDIVEVAFLGRSNVGKSSIINALSNKRQLALSSSTPGKTKLINFFKIIYKLDDEKYQARFVDLPGFGYAKVSKKELSNWEKNLTEFIENRRSIRVFVQLIDSRHFDLEIDENVNTYLNSLKRPDQKIVQFFTKADKLNQKSKNSLFKKYPKAFLVSATKKTNIQKANEIIFDGLFKK